MATAPNFAAILQWAKINRPDINQHQLEALMQQDAFILVMAMSFDAGRAFQTVNPDAGKFLDPFKTYNPIPA